MAALDHLPHLVLHVIAQVVEAEFVVGAVGDVAGVGGPPLLIVETVDDDADAEAEEIVDFAHPARVAAGEVIVDGDDVDAAAGERVEIDRQRRDQGFALAGAHFGDRALVQHHAADQLYVKMALAQRALGRLAHGGESGDQEIVEGLASREFGAEFGRLGVQLLVAEAGEAGLHGVDRGDFRTIGLEAAVVGRPENFFENRA